MVHAALPGLAARRRIVVSLKTLRVLDWKGEERLALALVKRN